MVVSHICRDITSAMILYVFICAMCVARFLDPQLVNNGA